MKMEKVLLAQFRDVYTGRRPQSGAALAHDTVAAVSAERQGPAGPLSLAPLGELE